MLTIEKIKLNYVTFCNKLKKYNCYSEEMINDLGEKLMNASFSMTAECGSAYQGSLIDVVLNHLCTIAYSINEIVYSDTGKFSHMRVNNDMLMRVLLLQHISKAELFVDTRETWKINKGILYEFNDELKTSMKLGERSLYLCQKYGISLSEKVNYFITPLASLVRMANHFVAIEMKEKYKKSIKKEEIEE